MTAPHVDTCLHLHLASPSLTCLCLCSDLEASNNRLSYDVLSSREECSHVKQELEVMRRARATEAHQKAVRGEEGRRL